MLRRFAAQVKEWDARVADRLRLSRELTMTSIRVAIACALSLAWAHHPLLGDQGQGRLRIAWADNLLSIEAPPGQPPVPGGKLFVHYLEAYCRARLDRSRLARDRDQAHDAIGLGRARWSRLALECRLADGVIVRHKIVARKRQVDFQLVAHNPTRCRLAGALGPALHSRCLVHRSERKRRICRCALC